MDTHYVCPSCAGESKIPKVCDTEGCHLKGIPMAPCSCSDGSHSLVLNQNT